MDEQQWMRYLSLLACHESSIPSACVGCWYEQHPGGESFPGDRVSSTLCQAHRAALPLEVKPPDMLLSADSTSPDLARMLASHLSRVKARAARLYLPEVSA